MAVSKRQVAIFDVDGTIYRSSFLVELVEALIDRGFFPEHSRGTYEKEERTWLDRKGDYDAYINAVVKTFVRDIKGVHYGDFADTAESVVEANKDRVYNYTRDLLHDLKKRNYFLLAISHSPKTAVEIFCKKLGFDKVYGRLYELGPEERFTGRVVDEHIIANKANIVRRAVEKENLTLKHSVGVGDTDSDIAFLELVKRPIAFNPNSKLYRYAKRMKWKTVVERKDVVYTLDAL